jgi:hypothetical protein
MNSAIALVLLVRERYTISTFFSPVSGCAFAGSCALEQPDRRQMIAAIVSNEKVPLLIVEKNSTLPLLPSVRNINFTCRSSNFY